MALSSSSSLLFMKCASDVVLLLFSNSRLKIVDDDVDWQQVVRQEEAVEEDEDEAPVVRLLQTASCAHSRQLPLAFAFNIPTLRTKVFCQCVTKRPKDGDVENNNIENVVPCKRFSLNGAWIDCILYVLFPVNVLLFRRACLRKVKLFPHNHFCLN